MNFIKKFLLIIFLSIILIYVTNITSMPEKVVLFENEELELGQVFGLVIKDKINKTVETSVQEDNIKTKTVQVSLFNILNVKEIKVDTIKNIRVIPLGNTIGIRLYSSGVLVIGMSEIEGKKPYENTGIKEGDLIIEVDNVQVTTTEMLIECVNKCEGDNIEIKYIREGTEHTTQIEPVKTKNNEYKMGIWVRDGAVGIGTATYYEPESNKIATLGHGIIDKDTDQLITIESGELTTSTITKITKGIEGIPGEIRGVINNNRIIGTINKNTKFGIYGILDNTSELGINKDTSVEVAKKEDIEKGKATVLLNLEDNVRKEYEIEIKKIYTNNAEDNKSMLIEITDEELIKKTGGIVQRNEWSTNITKWKIYWSNYTCINK